MTKFYCEHAEKAGEGQDDFTKGYINALYFAEAGDDFQCSGVDRLPMSEELLEQCREDCWQFKKRAGKLLEGLDQDQCGYFFLLTRNRHETNFLNKGLGDVGIRLTELAHSFGYTSIMNFDNKLQLA